LADTALPPRTAHGCQDQLRQLVVRRPALWKATSAHVEWACRGRGRGRPGVLHSGPAGRACAAGTFATAPPFSTQAGQNRCTFKPVLRLESPHNLGAERSAGFWPRMYFQTSFRTLLAQTCELGRPRCGSSWVASIPVARRDRSVSITRRSVDFSCYSIAPVSRLSWKWRERSAVTITERTREETTKALHERGPDQAKGGRPAGAPERRALDGSLSNAESEVARLAAVLQHGEQEPGVSGGRRIGV
jgi:hypothetical protein